MSLIPDEQRERIRGELEGKLTNPVKVILFTQEMECKFCADTRELLLELAELSSKVQPEIHDFLADSLLAKEYGIDKIPALVVRTEKDYGVRFYGFPYGYEFQTLMETLSSVSKGYTDLSEETKRRLQEIKAPIVIKVFTSLTCGHCATAASMANKFAVESSMIRAEAIDAGEFPDLAIKYGIMGVPKIVINEKIEFVGALPEGMFLEKVLEAVQ